MKLFFFYLVFLICFASGCDLRKKEAELQTKEAELNQREQELLLKEKTLQLKEEELLSKEKTDTLNKKTSGLYNPAIIGIWQVKMICTETTCPGSAVGDTKTEQWNISFEANRIIAKVLSDDKLMRSYIGIPSTNSLELVAEQDNTVAPSTTIMVVRLNLISPNRMEGQREIIRDNCKVTYSLQMEKQN